MCAQISRWPCFWKRGANEVKGVCVSEHMSGTKRDECNAIEQFMNE